LGFDRPVGACIQDQEFPHTGHEIPHVTGFIR
jgi:hypothetical protein